MVHHLSKMLLDASFDNTGLSGMLDSYLVVCNKSKEGPFKIITKHNPNRFSIQRLNHPLDNIFKVHIDRLIHATSRQKFLSPERNISPLIQSCPYNLRSRR